MIKQYIGNLADVNKSTNLFILSIWVISETLCWALISVYSVCVRVCARASMGVYQVHARVYTYVQACFRSPTSVCT